ncbi:MAG: metallophosphoesterase [Candidatus Thiodiazotropha sp.]
MRILIISDLHIGRSARCLSLIPNVDRLGSDGKEDEAFLKNKTDQKYIERLKYLKDSKNITVDYLILSGDITDEAEIEQFQHFDEFIGEVQHIFNLDKDKILFTPGNHDVDWVMLNGVPAVDPSSTRFSSRYDSLKKSELLFQIHELADRDLFSSPYFCAWKKNEDLFVLSINTAAYDSPKVKEHCGEISSDTTDAINDYMSNHQMDEFSGLKVILMHHHPKLYENIFPNWKDFSAIQCPKDIISISRNLGFDFIIHGHRHQPGFDCTLTSSGEQIAIICCGSFSDEFPYYVYEELSNQIHFLNIEKRDSETGVIIGCLENYAFTLNQGWQPSEKRRDGIDHKICFGPNEHREPLKNKIIVFLQAILTEKGKCEVTEIYQYIPSLKYQTESLVLSILNEVCNENNYDMFGNNLDKSVILMGDKNASD